MADSSRNRLTFVVLWHNAVVGPPQVGETLLPLRSSEPTVNHFASAPVRRKGQRILVHGGRLFPTELPDNPGLAPIKRLVYREQELLVSGSDQVQPRRRSSS
jgi:hypothetical protein